MSTDNSTFNFAGATFGAGTNINQSGGRNQVSIGSSGVPSDLDSATRALIEAVDALRAQVSAADRQVLDTNLETVRARSAAPGATRGALQAIAGVASLVGGVGVPVIGAVKAVLGLLTA